jgi:hypothetical protein
MLGQAPSVQRQAIGTKPGFCTRQGQALGSTKFPTQLVEGIFLRDKTAGAFFEGKGAGREAK